MCREQQLLLGNMWEPMSFSLPPRTAPWRSRAYVTGQNGVSSHLVIDSTGMGITFLFSSCMFCSIKST